MRKRTERKMDERRLQLSLERETHMARESGRSVGDHEDRNIGASPVQTQHVSFTYTLTTGRSDRARPVSATTSDSCRSSIHDRISCNHFFCQLEVTYLENGLQL